MAREIWIVFDGKEPTTAHLTLDGAKAAADWTMKRGQADGPFSIWTARLDADPADKGIPVHPTAKGVTLRKCAICLQAYDASNGQERAYHEQPQHIPS